MTVLLYVCLSTDDEKELRFNNFKDAAPFQHGIPRSHGLSVAFDHRVDSQYTHQVLPSEGGIQCRSFMITLQCMEEGTLLASE